MLLSACASIGASGPDRGERHWTAYAASAFSMPEGERLAAYAAAEQVYQTRPTANSAIRLAVLSLGIEQPRPDYESALALLSFAEGATDNAPDRDFVAFLRPIIQALADQAGELANETERRRMLQQQLEGLKELEEQLNADEDGQ
jgi:hypothetical protein